MEKQKNQLVINDQLISYYQFGSGQKSVIFLHGWRSSADAWFGVIEKLLSEDLSIFALDLPGFGASPAPKADWNLGDYADLVEGFIFKKEISNPILVGHSFGGRISIKLAANKLGLIRKLILVDSAGIRREFSGRKAIAKLVKPLFKPVFMRGLRKKIYKQMGSEDYLATPELKETYLNIIGEDLTPLLDRIKADTLIIWGSDDKETPLSDAEMMKSRIEYSELKVLENAGHFSFIDQPEEFVETIKNFINK